MTGIEDTFISDIPSPSTINYYINPFTVKNRVFDARVEIQAVV